VAVVSGVPDAPLSSRPHQENLNLHQATVIVTASEPSSKKIIHS
jgi:hypothetical protein